MSEPRVCRFGEGDVVSVQENRRVEVLSDDESVNATWSRVGAGGAGADLHVHRDHSDLFFVLEGELTVRLGVDDQPVAVPAGTVVRVPPMVVHGFRNDGDAEVRYLNFHAPGAGFAAYLRSRRDGAPITYDQHDPPEDGGRPVGDAAIGGGELVAERVILHADVEAIAIAEIATEPGAPAAEPHVHRRHVESLYVLEGELCVEVGDRPLRAEAGTWVQIPRNLPHTLSFPATGPARYLDVHTPSTGFGTYLRMSGDEALARSGFDQHAAR